MELNHTQLQLQFLFLGRSLEECPFPYCYEAVQDPCEEAVGEEHDGA